MWAQVPHDAGMVLKAVFILFLFICVYFQWSKMSPVTLVLIVPLVWECWFNWRGFFRGTFLIPVEALVLTRLRKMQKRAAHRAGEGSSPPPWGAAAVLGETNPALMGRFCSGKGTGEISLVRLISWLAFCWIPPFGNGFWLQDLQAMQQSINKWYKVRKASQGSVCCLQTGCYPFGGLFYLC